MFEINLIQNKAISLELKQKVRQFYIAGILLWCLIFAALLVGLINVSSKIVMYEREKAGIEAEIKQMITKYNIQEWGNQWGNCFNSINVVRNIYIDRIIWSVKLHELMSVLPEKVCIDKLNLSLESAEIAAKLIALDEGLGEFEQVKLFSDTLEQSPYFGTVKLELQTRMKVEEKSVKLIEVIIPLKKDIKPEAKAKNNG